MYFWQIFISSFGALALGSLLGLVTVRRVFRSKLGQDYYQADGTSDVFTISERSTPPEPASSKSAVPLAQDTLELKVQERKKSKKSAKTLEASIRDEVSYNLSVATTPSNGELEIFRTACWDNNSDIAKTIPADYMDELTQAYLDIRLANTIVSLSNNIGHISPDLELAYLQLCNKIADRLKKIVPF